MEKTNEKAERRAQNPTLAVDGCATAQTSAGCSRGDLLLLLLFHISFHSFHSFLSFIWTSAP